MILLNSKSKYYHFVCSGVYVIYVKQVQNGEHRCVKNLKILFDIIHKKSYNNIMIRLRIGKNSHNLTKCSHPDMVACRDADASKKCH